MKQESLAYFAGLLDGEGCIWIHSGQKGKHRGDFWQLRVSMVNTNPTPLIEAKELFGGSVTLTHKGGDYGNIHWRPTFTWCVVAKVATRFLMQVLPFLVIKKQEAAEALAFKRIQDSSLYKRRSKERKNILDNYVIKLRELKRITHYLPIDERTPVG